MSPRTEEANQRIRDEQRGKILQVAARVFARKGLAATKMADIAAAAGVSYGLAYHYFPSKERLFAELVESTARSTISLYQQALEQPGTPWDKLFWLVAHVLEGLQQLPEFGKLVFQVYASDAVPVALREIVRNERLLTRQIIQQLIVEGQAAGQVVVGDPVQLTTALTACIQGLAFDTLFAEEEVAHNLPAVEDILRLVKAS